MRQVITEREEVHRMSSKNKTEVLIDGKIYTLSGYESEEYLQRVATYINNKLAELKKLDGYARLSQELKSILLELNVADDYFKAKKQGDSLESDIELKDKEMYDLKHELISLRMQIEEAQKNEQEALDEKNLLEGKVKELEKELADAKASKDDSDAHVADLEAQSQELQNYKQNEAAFEEEKEKFYQEVVFSDKAPDISAYKEYYESIEPQKAEEIYKQVVEQTQENDEIKAYASTYSSMKPKQAAAIFNTMTDNLQLVGKILWAMDAQSRGNILGAMDADTAAAVTKLMEP